MDAKRYAQMLADKHLCDLKRMQYKYSRAEVAEMLSLMKDSVFTVLPIKDFNGNPLVYAETTARISLHTIKLLLAPQNSAAAYGVQAMAEEIHNSLKIENIASSRDSIGRILKGYAPINDSENRIFGMKKGLEFISDKNNRITTENLRRLYQLTVGDFLEDAEKLAADCNYRHDRVYIVGDKVEHEGLPHALLPRYMEELLAFINTESKMNDLLKAALIHFYIAYLHPYFDGNGRTARFVQLWYLVQQGYSSAMFVPFSGYINETRQSYYKAYTQIEENQKISGVIDVTPFLTYFIENVYNKLNRPISEKEVLPLFSQALEQGKITVKERDLWNYVLSVYGTDEFSTKQLERDYANAAYATIRSFVLKFTELGLLQSQRYGNRVKYHIPD